MIKNLYFNSRDELLRVNIDNVVFFEGDGGYTDIVSANELRSCVGMNLRRQAIYNKQEIHLSGKGLQTAADSF